MSIASGSQRLTSVQWLICTIAAIGFAFDIYELLMLPLIVRPALMELGGIAPGTDEFGMWVGRLFYIPAIAGGIFGLLGGYMTDRLGRRRVLTFSILLYAVSAFVAGFSTSLWMLLTCRCLVFVGVCVEFVAAVAWLAELFDDPHRREKVLGYTQAFSSIGGLMIAVANGLAVKYAFDLPSVHMPGFLEGMLGTVKDPNAAWRYTLMSGLIPAVPLIIIRPFLPESPKWAMKKEAGTLRRPSFGELFSPKLRRTTIVTATMFACSFGAAFGAIQHMPQMVPGLPEVRAKVDAAVQEKAAGKPKPEQMKVAKLVEQEVASNVTKVQEVGGLVGRVLLAVLAVIIVASGNTARIGLANERIQAYKDQLAEVQQQLRDLTIVAPVTGTIVEPPRVREPSIETSRRQLSAWNGTPLDRKNLGATLEERTHLLSIAPGELFQAVVLIDQSDVNEMVGATLRERLEETEQQRQPVEIKLDHLPARTYEAHIKEVSRNPLDYVPELLSNKLGGELPTVTDSQGRERLISPVYQANVELTEDNQLLRAGMRGRARFLVEERTAFQWLKRYILQTFHFRL